MNKVTTINLNGRAYQLEEQGFEALRKYLETAAAKLDGNPDKDEIMADFEQAIAEKCDQKLSPAKNVVSEKEVEDIITTMGPVEGNEKVKDANGTSSTSGSSGEPTGTSGGTNTNSNHGAGSSGASSGGTSGGSSSTSSNTGFPKRLYRIPRGEWIMGVCNGLAAYFNMDVTLMRVIWILLTIFTHGFWIIAYIILAIVMPPVRSEEQFAEAHGWSSVQAPLTANDFIEEAKRRYAEWRAELEKMHEEHKAKTASQHGWTKDDVAAAKENVANIKEETQNWKQNFKQEMRQKKQQMKQEWRAQQRQWRDERWHGRYDNYNYGGPGSDYPSDPGVSYGPAYGFSRAIFGFFAVLVSIVLLATGITWIYSLYTLIKYHEVFGYALGAGHPLWVSILFLAAAFYVVAIPFRLLLQHAWGNTRYHGYRSSAWADFGRFIVFVAMLAVLIYTARELFPQVNTAWNASMVWLKMKL